MRAVLEVLFPQGTSRRWALSGFLRSPIRFPASFLNSLVATLRLTGAPFPILVRVSAGQRFHVSVNKAAKIEVKGVLSILTWEGSKAPSSLSIGDGGSFSIASDFQIGPNVHLLVSKGARLDIAGVQKSSASGITCDSRIMAEERITIGADTIIAWGVFISDSNWHDVTNSPRSTPVVLGEHVWISHGVSILKGSHVPDGCIVGTHSVVRGGQFPARSLLAGNPAVVKREGVEWKR